MVVETAVTEAARAEPLAECKATKRQPTANAWIFHAKVWGIGGGSGSGSDDGSSDSGGGGGDVGGDGSSKCGGGGGGGLKLPPPLPFLPAVIKHDQHRNGIKSMAQHMHMQHARSKGGLMRASDRGRRRTCLWPWPHLLQLASKMK